MAWNKQILIVESRYYPEIADALFEGAVAVLEKYEKEYLRIEAPGAFEIPARVVQFYNDRVYAGVITLGCVIRGETAHFDIVAGESARALMDLTYKQRIPIGNGILTVENEEQAWERADPKRKNKGGEAARTALFMAGYKDALNQ